LLLISIAPAHAQQGCAVSQDLVVRALEPVSAKPSNDDLSNGILLLKQAAQACDENGDAWYYRSLFERRLGQGNPDYSLRQARDRNSAALRDNDDPFRLSTPARGVLVNPAPNAAPGTPRTGPALDIRKPDVNRKWALVVGIAKFHYDRLNLRYTRKDAEAIAALFQDPTYGHFAPDHIRLIADEDATTVNFRAGLNWLARMAGEGDLAVIYIATHGTARDQDVAGANYVVTYDTDVQSLDGLYSTAIPMVEISNDIRTRIRALKVAVFLDTCHSAGAIAQTVTVPSSISAQTLDRIREGTGRAIIAASQVDESSYEQARYGHGLFTYYLLQGLREQKDAPLDKLYAWVKDHVAQDAERNHWKQHPVFSASDTESDIVIGTPPLNPAAGLNLLPRLFPGTRPARSAGIPAPRSSRAE
jgi:hypothetical protein